mmetsp:Transcript_47608/g.102624  ORF Transcript_47608/g.102624 Transcript_47608/m.102624 type:complete len:207 (+) Transcript_47608:346-966(+)
MDLVHLGMVVLDGIDVVKVPLGCLDTQWSLWGSSRKMMKNIVNFHGQGKIINSSASRGQLKFISCSKISPGGNHAHWKVKGQEQLIHPAVALGPPIGWSQPLPRRRQSQVVLIHELLHQLPLSVRDSRSPRSNACLIVGSPNPNVGIGVHSMPRIGTTRVGWSRMARPHHPKISPASVSSFSITMGTADREVSADQKPISSSMSDS